MSSAHARVVHVLIIGMLFVYPMVYLGMYAGDAEIHLVYGANAAEGRFFEFNRGESSPGVTSPGFMLMVAGLFRLLPAAEVPLAVKVINLLAWYGLCLTVFLLARRLGLTGAWAWVAAVVAGLIPGSAYNATIGMENGLFALVVLVWIQAALITGWFDVAPVRSARHALLKEGLLGAILGVSVWLRPEGVVVGFLALVHRASRSSRAFRAGVPLWSSASRSLAFLIPFILVTGLVVAFHYSSTGYLLPTSGRARMLMGSLDAFWIGPIAFNTRVIGRLLAYLPLTIAWCVGIRLVLHRRASTEPASVATEFLGLLAMTCFILYSTVLGSAHLARYLIFAMPPFVLVSILGARRLWALRRPWGRVAVLALAATLAAVFAAETRERMQLGSHDELRHAMRAPTERASVSDALFRALDSPTELPIVIAYQEVQARYWLDDRFVVRSLDGRTDPLMLEFAGRTRFDHVRYIKSRGIRFLMELPNYNRDRDAWSLEELRTLGPAERLIHDGLVFNRLPGDRAIIQVAPVR